MRKRTHLFFQRVKAAALNSAVSKDSVVVRAGADKSKGGYYIVRISTGDARRCENVSGC